MHFRWRRQKAKKTLQNIYRSRNLVYILHGAGSSALIFGYKWSGNYELYFMGAFSISLYSNEIRIRGKSNFLENERVKEKEDKKNSESDNE